LLESIFEPVLYGLIGFLIYEFVPIPNKFFKVGNYIVIVLLPIAGILFVGYFGYGVYGLITEPKSMVENSIFGAVLILVLLMSFGSFYLSHKAWKNR
jgi:hypothetical protein